MPLIQQDIESEISYAYLHAIASAAGMSCKWGNRHDDNAGIDAQLTWYGPTPHSYITQVPLNVQLKATVKSPGQDPNYLSYFLAGEKRYNKLCKHDSNTYTVLVVLFLPANDADWLNCTPQQLVVKEAAYWTCLRGADACANQSGETVYIPRTQLLTSTELKRIVDMAVMETIPPYTKP